MLTFPMKETEFIYNLISEKVCGIYLYSKNLPIKTILKCKKIMVRYQLFLLLFKRSA